MKKSCKQVIQVSLLLTGSELLSGKVTDTNSLFIEQKLHVLGLNVFEKRVIADDLTSIKKALNSLSSCSDILIVNGGLGSTDDDLTRIAVANTLGLPLIENQKALDHLQARLGFLPDYGSSQHTQAMLPSGAISIHNSVGSALGFYLSINECTCFFLPGVPREMEVILQDEVLPVIQDQFELPPPSLDLNYTLIGIGEMQIQKALKAHLPESVNKNMHLGFKVDNPLVELKLIFNNNADKEVQKECNKIVIEIFSAHICSTSSSLAERVVELARIKNERIAFAESCTGGKIAATITEIPGVSELFEFALVSYSNRSKSSLLQVPEEVIVREGAVSGSVAKLMVEGALNKGMATLAASVTGIAGPSGGSPEKPVGTVYIAWGNQKNIHVRKLLVKQSRLQFQRTITLTVLDLLRKFILDEPTNTPYRFDELSKKKLDDFLISKQPHLVKV